MSEEAAQGIREAIRDHGPITFAEFMEFALYGPGGFYEEPPIGQRGHFVTSPHVHPVFGRLVAEALRQTWAILGKPEPLVVVEVGAGDGTLARQILEAARDIPIEYHAVDRSPGARKLLAELPVRVHASIEAAPQHVTGVVFANELLDNLPFHRIRRTRKGAVEIRVDMKGDRFVEVETPCSEEVLEELEAMPERKDRKAFVLSAESLHFLDRVVRVLAQGVAILIDYEQTSKSEIHGYRRHEVIADVLPDPGSADITAPVDFEALADRAVAWGLGVAGPFTQRTALDALGYGEWNLTERETQTAHLEEHRGLEAVRAWATRSAASLLVDPAGLGALRWLLLRKGDPEWPAWVTAAQAMHSVER